MPVTVFDILAKRNADKLRAVSADGASVRYHLRMSDGVVGIIDTFELLDGVSLMFNSIPRGTAEWGDVEPRELQIDWCLRGRFELETANGRTIRLGEGELAFHDERVRKRVMSFPAPLYTGLTLRIDRSAGARARPSRMRYRPRRAHAQAHGRWRVHNLHARPLDARAPRIILGRRRARTPCAVAPQGT